MDYSKFTETVQMPDAYIYSQNMINKINREIFI
jgi:hypothetical protein